MQPADTTEKDIMTLTIENNRLLLENNVLLKKMDRRAIRGFWFKVLWFIVLFVLPLLFLPYLFNSYLDSLKLAGDGAEGAPALDSTDSLQQVLDLLQNQ